MSCAPKASCEVTVILHALISCIKLFFANVTSFILLNLRGVIEKKIYGATYDFINTSIFISPFAYS